jgi:bacillithiol system protein YtxJ
MTEPRVPSEVSDDLTSCEELSTVADFDAVVAESFKRPVMILKHSDSCGRSEHAMETVFRELEGWAHGVKDVSCRVVIVQERRGLSDAIEQRLRVRHETPQLILIRNGRVVWHASHWGITDSAMRRALADASDSGS